MVRGWLITPTEPPGELRLLGGGPPGSPQAHKDSALRVSRPLGPGERIDLDRAGALEISRLPRVGLELARTIVADRTARGPFGSLEGLDRVPGVGPGLLRSVAPHAAFSGVPRAPPPSDPGAGAARTPVNLNTATAAELETLPFVGPRLAREIVASRERHGPFTSVDSLVRVPGIGPSTVRRLREFVLAP